MKKNILFLILMVFIFAACKKKTATVDMKTDYFPLKVGSWIIYDVDSTYYDDFLMTHHKHHFQLKELIADAFTDLQGNAAFRVERYERDSASQTFQIKNVCSENIVNNQAQRVENNLRFVKMVFPPQTTVSWKGNIYIQPDLTSIYTKFLGDWDYQYSFVEAPNTFGGNSFSATATVVANDELVPGLQQTTFIETYARNVGLVYYHHKFVEKQPSDTTWVSGFDVTATVNSFGN